MILFLKNRKLVNFEQVNKKKNCSQHLSAFSLGQQYSLSCAGYG
jgi:hypothetical protein